MDSRKLVLTETGIVAAGQAVCTAAMMGIFALLHQFDTTVVVGGIVGALVAICNFFAMAMGAMIAADKAAQDDVKGGKATIKASMTGRLVAMAVILIVFPKSGYCHLIALLVPMVFTRPVLTLYHFFRKSGEENT